MWSNTAFRSTLFRRLPLIIAATYGLVSAAWILLSDELVSSITTDPVLLQQLQTYKGGFFITASALLILVILRAAWRIILEAYVNARESEQRLELALSNAGGTIWESGLGDDQQSLVHLSRGAMELFGKAPQEPMTMGELSARRHPDDIKESDRAFRNLATGASDFLDIRYRIMAAGGSYRWFHSRGKLVRAEDGRPLKMMGVSLDITDQVNAEQRINELLRFDPLTGLPKPAKFLGDVEALLAGKPNGALAIIQLKLVNFDRLIGDEETADEAVVARVIADRLKDLPDPFRAATRVSWDTFALATRPCGSIEEIDRAIASVHRALVLEQAGGSRPIQPLRFVVGAAAYPRDGVTATALLRNSGHAMSSAEKGGTVLWFTEGMNTEFRLRNERLRSLGEAAVNGEIECFLQPLVNLSTGRTAGFEALARWRRPGEGLVTPDQFIPLAEETGQIGQIDEEIMRQACQAALGWAGSGSDDLFVAVNASPLQLERPDFAAMVARILGETGLPPHRLEVEITESTLAHDREAAAARLRELRSLGVSIAIDDFGTGYSSLARLSRFPVSRVKIDRSFTVDYGQKRDATTIVNTVIDLCGVLGFAVTAEGIETQEQALALRAQGVTLGQGYWFSRPVPAAEAIAMLDRNWLIEAGVDVEQAPSVPLVGRVVAGAKN